MRIQDQLQVVCPGQEVEIYHLDPQGVTLIGRHPSNHILLDGPGIARFHAVLHHRDKPYRIQALRKTQLTLGGRRLTAHASAVLHPGDRFQIGDYTLALLTSQAAASEAAPSVPRRRVYRLSATAQAASDQTLGSLLARLKTPPLSGPRLMALALVCLIVLAVYAGRETRSEPNLVAKSIVTSRADTVAATHAPNPTVDQPEPAPLNARESGELSFEEMFQEVGEQYGLDGRLLIEIAYKESEFNLHARGARGELGLMQIHPATWRVWATKVGVTDPDDAYSNVLVAADYLDYLRDDCQSMGHPGTFCMLLSYNWGPGNLRQHLEGGGSLADVPEWPHSYASELIQATDDISEPWREILPSDTVIRPTQLEAGQED